MFQILARRGCFVVPIFYALLPNKHRETYDRLFHLTKELRPQMNPISVATDFELAEFGAIRDAWPTSQIHACFFHLNQSMHRQVEQLGTFPLIFHLTFIFRSQSTLRQQFYL